MDKLKSKAFAEARIIVRNKILEIKGLDFDSLTEGQANSLNSVLNKKESLIQELAEKRYNNIVSSLNEDFKTKFAEKKKSKKLSPQVIQHEKFSDDDLVREDSSVYKALIKKADKSGVEFNTLKEVYTRGFNVWNESINVTQQQYAFARVNSFINKGKTYFNEDVDLVEGIDYEQFAKDYEAQDKQYGGKMLHLTKRYKEHGDFANGHWKGPGKKKDHIIVGRDDKSYEVHKDHVSHDPKDSWANNLKEQTEINELTKGLLARYVKKSAEDMANAQGQGVSLDNIAKRQPHSKDKEHMKSKADEKWNKVRKRKAGISLAVTKMIEEAEPLEEAKSLSSGINHLGKSVFDKRNGRTGVVRNSFANGSHSIKWNKEKEPTTHDWHEVKNHIRISTSKDEHKKYVKESTTEQLEELSINTLKSYQEKSTNDRTKQFGRSDKASKKLGNANNSVDDRLDASSTLVKAYKKDTPGEANEDVKAGDKVPVLVPAHYDQYDNVIPAKTVLKHVGKKIIKSGNVHDGKADDE